MLIDGKPADRKTGCQTKDKYILYCDIRLPNKNIAQIRRKKVNRISRNKYLFSSLIGLDIIYASFISENHVPGYPRGQRIWEQNQNLRAILPVGILQFSLPRQYA
jgi:hypothetical protein